jgi:hypothetical protein
MVGSAAYNTCRCRRGLVRVWRQRNRLACTDLIRKAPNDVGVGPRVREGGALTSDRAPHHLPGKESV